MIATIIGLVIAFWLVALLIAAVADHPQILLVPLLVVLVVAGLAYSGDRPGYRAPDAQPVYASDYPEMKRAIATYGDPPVHACFDAVKARNGTEDELWACIKALPSLPGTDWTMLISVVATIIGLLATIAVAALIADGVWRRASSARPYQRP